jgi:hypothetical protein
MPTVPTCRVAAALLAALLLGACGDLPKPFAHQGPTDNALLRLEDSAGIVVAPPAGAPPHTGARLADAVTEALGAVNVPATVRGGNRQSFRLTGQASVHPAGGGREEIVIDWRLTDGAGAARGEIAQRHPAPDGSWRVAAPEVMQGIATAAAPRIAGLIQDHTAAEAPPPGVFVAAVEGAPGNGNEALRRAMTGRLQRHGIRIADQGGGRNTFSVAATVDVGDAVGGTQEVRVSWRVLDAEGAERGSVDQANSIAAGSLDADWGAVAEAVAAAAAAGVLEVVEQALNEPAKVRPGAMHPGVYRLRTR